MTTEPPSGVFGYKLTADTLARPRGPRVHRHSSRALGLKSVEVDQRAELVVAVRAGWVGWMAERGREGRVGGGGGAGAREDG